MGTQQRKSNGDAHLIARHDAPGSEAEQVGTLPVCELRKNLQIREKFALKKHRVRRSVRPPKAGVLGQCCCAREWRKRCERPVQLSEFSVIDHALNINYNDRLIAHNPPVVPRREKGYIARSEFSLAAVIHHHMETPRHVIL